jgi:cellulose biosynthesis protein BcsQ
MQKIRIVLADTDEKYLMPLEKKFIDAFEDSAEINVISDPTYLVTFFSTPQNLDILVINEELYNNGFERHNISNTFILSEQPIDDTSTGNLNTNRIYKYTSVKEIINEVMNNNTSNSIRSLKTQEQTKTIMVYSPAGGAGTTTTACGLSAALSKNFKRVLFLGTDNLQSFGYLLADQRPLPGDVEKPMAAQNEYIYELIKPHIRREVFDYIPRFARSLSSLNITSANLMYLVDCIKASKNYDFIIVDTMCDFTEDISKMMSYADTIITVVGQDRVSTYKLERLLQNIDCSDKNKFLFVCNKYKPGEANLLVDEPFINNCHINEYVDLENSAGCQTIDSLNNMKGFLKLAFLFI